MRRLSVLLALAVAACGGGGGAVGQVHGFPAAALATLDGEAGRVHLELRSDPPTPARGDNTLELRIRDTSGQPLDGAAVTLQPWMPEMGHGSAVAPTVVPQGQGIYRIEHVDLAMPGSWQLRFTIGGKVEDHATFVVQIA